MLTHRIIKQKIHIPTLPAPNYGTSPVIVTQEHLTEHLKGCSFQIGDLVTQESNHYLHGHNMIHVVVDIIRDINQVKRWHYHTKDPEIIVSVGLWTFGKVYTPQDLPHWSTEAFKKLRHITNDEYVTHINDHIQNHCEQLVQLYKARPQT